MRRSIPLSFLIILSGCLSVAFAADAPPQPLPSAHAHNDYLHKRPLLDALEHGFCSVEADVFLVRGDLLVAHTALDIRAERTLQALYLDPLRARARANGGRVYPHGPTITLLVDFKVDLINTDDLAGLQKFLIEGASP
jgi:hypothetical protein